MQTIQEKQHSISQIIAILKQAEKGTPIEVLCRRYRISSASFYQWKSTYDDRHRVLLSTLEVLKEKNRRLRSRHAEMQLQKEFTQKIFKKTVRDNELQQKVNFI